MNPFLFLGLIVLCTNCEKDFCQKHPYGLPPETHDGLQIESLQNVHMDQEMTCKAADRIRNGKYGEIPERFLLPAVL